MASFSSYKNKSVVGTLLAPFSYVFIGAFEVVKRSINLIKYMSEGTFFVVKLLIINPLKGLRDIVLNIVDALSPRQVKRAKELKLSVNFDEKGEVLEKSEIKPSRKKEKKKVATVTPPSPSVVNSPIVKPVLVKKSDTPNVEMMKVQSTPINNNSSNVKKQPGITSGIKKDIDSQMKNNQLLLSKSKKKSKINEKQKAKLDQERDSLLRAITDGQEKRLEKPQTFRYKALTPDGKVETSTFVGVSKLDIYTFLTGEGYTVISIETSPYINFMYGQSFVLYRRMSTKDLIFFITQLATYIKSGVTLTEAVRILSKQLRRNKKQHRITQSIVYYLTMGESFSSALDHQTGAFPPLVINMVRAAEAAGNLDETLEDLIQYYEELNATHKQMISAISYPALVGCFSIVIIVFIMVKIIPQFVGIYSSAGAHLNPLTTFVIDLSTFLRLNIGIIAILVLALIVGLVFAYKKVQPFRKQVQILIMRIPIIGKILIYNELTIFTKTFASLLKNDVFITDSMDILSKVTNNEVYKEIMMDTMNNIARGDKISDSFNNHWAIPEIAYYMIVTGETTGQLAEMMKKVSDYYQEQHRTIVNSLKNMIEPVLIIFLAVIVGGVLIAVILPMFELYNEVA